MRTVCLLFVLALISSAHAQITWTKVDTHQVDAESLASKAKLSAEQTALLQKLDSNLDNLLIEKIDLGAQAGYAVEASSDSQWCSPTGNCTFWILDAQMHVLLQHIAQTFAVLQTTTHGQHDIVLRMHGSATDSSWGLYHFTGTVYHRMQCADVNYSPDPDVELKEPAVTLLSCKTMQPYNKVK
jgi:hypothetical protein